MQAICGHGTQLFSGDTKCLKVWDVTNMTQVHKIDVAQVKAIQYSADLGLLVASSNKDLIVWETNTFTKVGEFKGQS